MYRPFGRNATRGRLGKERVSIERGRRVALVTGSTSGLAREMALYSAAAGARVGVPENVAAAAVTFLAGEGTGYVRGVVLNVDGGLAIA